tara:strand:+ start:332 stop:493 length:162 start_codon:yes stop_codon:yes gene_type:complete
MNRIIEKEVPIINKIRPLLKVGAMTSVERLINGEIDENKKENESGNLDASGRR